MKKHWGNYFTLFCVAASLTLSPIALATTASASTVKEAAQAADTEGEAVEEADTEGAVEKENVSDKKNKNSSEKDTASEKKETIEKKKTSKKNAERATEEEEEVSYTQKTLTITKDGFVADTFNGVDAIYRKGSNDGSNATYSCRR